MSVRFRLCAGGILAASMVTGLALGDHATTVPVHYAGGDLPETAMVEESQAPPLEDALRPPGPIVCKGCGPTLADRRFAADMAALDADGMVHGSTDPVVVDYMRDEVPEHYPTPVAEPLPAHRLPANVQRLAEGGHAEPAPTVAARALTDAPTTKPATVP